MWIQWGLCWIKKDTELVQFLERLRKAIKPPSDNSRKNKSGLLFVKENSDPVDTKGREDTYGKTRTVARLTKVFEKAGFVMLYSRPDHNYPDGYEGVWCYVLRPKWEEQ